MKLTYEAILDDPKILDRILAEARRSRADAMYRMLIQPLTRIFDTHAAPKRHVRPAALA